MAQFQSQSNVTVHLGPGTFTTQGYAIGAGTGWQARPGMKILGSGIDVTTLQLVSVGANEHYYAIGHALGSTTKADLLMISDLTIDCALPSGVTSVACGAIRAMGDHVKIRRVKAINWGTTASGATRPCYVFSVITAAPDAGVADTVNAGIEDCIAISPSTNNAGQATAFHAGSQEDASITNEGFGKSPYIRSCFVDCGITTPNPDPAVGKYRGLSMGWCRGGVVEGNQVYNTDIGGPYQGKRSARDIIVRNQFYKNVARGPYLKLGVLGSSLGSAALSRSGSVATVSSLSSVAGLAVGDRVKIVTSNSSHAFDGVYVINSVQQSPAQFTVTTPVTSDTSATVTSVQKVYGLSRAIIEGNIVELVSGVSGVLGAQVDDGNGTNYTEGPDYVHGDIFIRNNKIRYVDGATPTGGSDVALLVTGAKNLQISNNVVDSANTTPLQNQRGGSVKYFNNLSPSGTLIQGVNPDTQNKYSEPATDAEDALVLAFLEI